MSTPERAPNRYGYTIFTIFDDDSDLDLDTPIVPTSTGRTIAKPKEKTIELEEVPVLMEESPILAFLERKSKGYCGVYF